MPQYFLCYRREDTAGHSGRLYGDLVRAFDEESVFFDLRSVPAGEDFREVVRSSIAACDVVLVLIGRNWQPKLLHDPADYVRHEIEAALAGGKRIVPVLVQGTLMPEPETLPEPIRQMAYRNASEISDRHWDADVKALIRTLRGRGAGGRRRWLPMALGAAVAIVAVVLAYVAMQRRADPEPPTTTATQPETTVATQPPITTGTEPPVTNTTTQPPTNTQPPTTTNVPPTVTATLVDQPLKPKYPKPGSGVITNPFLFPFPVMQRTGGMVATASVAAGTPIGIRANRSSGINYAGMLYRDSRGRRMRTRSWTPAEMEAGVTETMEAGSNYELVITVASVASQSASVSVTINLGGKTSAYTLLPAEVPMTYKWRAVVQ